MARHIPLPVRNLAQIGIVTDGPSYDLPLNGFTGGSNVVFENGAVRDAPIWRKAFDLGTTVPVYAISMRGTQTYDETFHVTSDGRIFRFQDRSNTEVTPAGFTPIEGITPFTGTVLGSVVYISRETHVPMCRLPTETQFKPLPNWDPNWRAKAVRSFRDFVFAINVTKNGVDNPNLVKWSNLALQGQVPNTWDSTDISNNVAGENPLTDATAPLIDAGTLRDFFMIYGGRETFKARYVEGQFIFDFQKVSGNGGIINANCFAEVNGEHYVFGPNNIYKTDGTNQVSISEGMVNNEIYGTMNKLKAHRFFVFHNAKLGHVMFCFVSGNNVHFENTEFCNRAAVFNYKNNTWSFADLPNVPMMVNSNMDSRRTWDEVEGTWDDDGGTWYDEEHSSATHAVGFACQWSDVGSGRSIPTSRVVAYDYLDDGSVGYPMDPDCYAPVWIERINIDLDELQLPIKTQKSIRELAPQVDTARNMPFVFRIGAGRTASERTYSDPVEYNPTDPVRVKVDSRATGRYLNIRGTTTTPAGFKWSGYDLLVLPIGRR
ncbi:hypothetical protein [Teichococcus vastitatis]|uniref:Virion structural protein n=1 Tax=Teichococcus vastitatis TaxID=2307076 RepID=A0ABS9WDE7_9PROT|nr:hypothetical protein [Pseudoroseomonas vastitatis]MCI0756684.1 hypothetical protein [Pseudoroseomonas vastitatis]